MSIQQHAQRFTARFGRLHVSWITVAVFAIVIAYVDGFLVTSLQGAVGAIERNQPPFMRWLRDSTLMLPLFFLAVVAALLVARRFFGHGRAGLKLLASAALVVGLTTGVAVGEVAASAAYDYSLQSSHLAKLHAYHSQQVAPNQTAAPTSSCNAVCSARRNTLHAHLRALKLAGVVLVLSNLVLVGWVLAIRGGRLWVPRRSSAVAADDPAPTPAAMGGALA